MDMSNYTIELTPFQQRLYDKATKVANRKRGV